MSVMMYACPVDHWNCRGNEPTIIRDTLDKTPYVILMSFLLIINNRENFNLFALKSGGRYARRRPRGVSV